MVPVDLILLKACALGDILCLYNITVVSRSRPPPIQRRSGARRSASDAG